jgi:hypothetical protein
MNRPITSRSMHTFRTVALVGSLALAATGTACRSVVAAHGSDAAAARAHADALAMAMEHRFTRVDRSPKFAHARMRIARYALAPSKLVSDTALWTRSASTGTGATRDLEVAAALTNNRFVFSERPGALRPARVGDERHVIRLAQLGESDWKWSTEVEHAVGTMPPQRLNDVARAIFASMERTPAAIRADYGSTLPRTTRALGRLLVVDSIITTAQGDGSTLVAAHIVVEGARLRPAFPNFARYIEKYVEPARYRVRLADRTGGDWFDAHSDDRRLVIRFRSRNGELQPLRGGARRMPDTLALHVDARAKLGVFSVGFSRMQGEFVHVNRPADRSWAMRFTREPEWHLPLIAERLLRTPLRRPFEGPGVQFRIGFRTGEAGQTLLSRNLDAVVRESAIMRFLGNLGFGAMSDFAGKVELEENRFIAELFAAIRADLRAL